MRNRALHDVLREFALEAAAFLSQEQRDGGELQFEVCQDASSARGPALYRYRPLTREYIAERWGTLRSLPSCARAAAALGEGAARYLRMTGPDPPGGALSGEDTEPALQAMLERLYEDATSFGFPEERFERIYREVERTLYQGSAPATVAVPLRGARLPAGKVEVAEGLSLARRAALHSPPQMAWGDEAPDEGGLLCLLERDLEPGEQPPGAEATNRFRRLVTSLRLFKEGGVALGEVGWQRVGDGQWQPLAMGGTGAARSLPWTLGEGQEDELRHLHHTLEHGVKPGRVEFALSRFDFGCGRDRPSDALSDYLLALRALLDAGTDPGRGSLSLRLAALCAEEGERRAVRHRVERAMSLERFLMAGGTEEAYVEEVGSEPPAVLVAEVEGYLRALLRDVVCGYLEPNLRAVADDILLESSEPFHVEARDIRPRATPSGGARGTPIAASGDEAASAQTSDGDATSTLPAEHGELRSAGATGDSIAAEEGEPAGVTPSADWAPDDDPESYSAPI